MVSFALKIGLAPKLISVAPTPFQICHVLLLFSVLHFVASSMSFFQINNKDESLYFCILEVKKKKLNDGCESV